MNRKEKRKIKKEINIFEDVVNIIKRYFPQLTQKLEYGLREYGIIKDEQLDEILSQINMLYVSTLQV